MPTERQLFVTMLARSFAAVSMSAAFTSAALAAPPQYEVLPVTGPSPFIYTWIMDLSNAGHAVGYASAAAPALDPARAFLWSADNAQAPAIDLGDFGKGWPYATAEGVNDAGTVVGWAQVGPGTYRGFVWNAPGPMMQLSSFARAIDVDNAGRVLGLTLTGGGAIWQSGTYTSFPPLPGGHVFVPAAMNDVGLIVGRGVSTADNKQHAFVYVETSGQYFDLGMAPGDDWDSEAVAVNDSAQILGMSRRLGQTAITSRMVIWEPIKSGGWSIANIVDPLPGHNQLIMTDLNAAGHAVGMSGWPQVPVLWHGGQLHNINSLLAAGQSAVFFIGTSINDHGWVAVDGQFGCCGYVLKPIPSEPKDCPGDLTGSGSVGVPDLLQLLSCWGPFAQGDPCAKADLTGSGSVGVPDLLGLLGQWGPCPE